MKVILDLNIILSALIRDSITRNLILDSKLDLYFPETSFHKIKKYESYIIKKSEIAKEEYELLMQNLFKHITIIKKDSLLKHWHKAKSIMENIDAEDVTFIAAALAIDDSVIWSDDKDFDRQNKVKVLKTKDITEMFRY